MTSGGNNFIDFPDNQLTNLVCHARMTISYQSSVSTIRPLLCDFFVSWLDLWNKKPSCR